MTATDPYENVPTALVYDTFAETATQLTGRYVHKSDTAPTAEERQQWWQKVMDLRDVKRSVPAHDRTQLIAHIQRWTAELKVLKAEQHG
ncbi:hypothetical protein OG264_38905 (plasmid) [Streptomyces xanthophaeus]|uniref:hypothetical protein n=1 Tax=Streptomyces xanthophaeus TaxID=67385 RepID=UPI002F90A4F8|nr:hypothetical protein OG264_38905 [Streptomyces xanthophaeus]WST65866.1 hypothetical protein OG605_39900 [Streptomyces xanthophaeus]